jgi:lipooligosaccharide transport system ATP-binding protein
MLVIEVRDLRKGFGPVTAVDGLSFSLERGEFYGLLGPNGAGKTSTIRMLYGISPLGGGSLKVFGLDIAAHWREIRTRTGVCQQDNTLDPDLSVEQNLFVYAGYFGLERSLAKARTAELLDFFALSHKREAKVMELSGGMIRRLSLARSLINEPELLILDEPTTGLDPQSRHQVWDRLQALRKKGLTLLLTTHYMDEAERLCDRLLIMDHGRLLVEGSPRELIDRHAGRDVVEVEEAGADMLDWARAHGLTFDRSGTRLILYIPEAALGQVEADFSRLFCAKRCTLRRASLEDVFLRLTGRELRE